MAHDAVDDDAKPASLVSNILSVTAWVFFLRAGFACVNSILKPELYVVLLTKSYPQSSPSDAAEQEPRLAAARMNVSDQNWHVPNVVKTISHVGDHGQLTERFPASRPMCDVHGIVMMLNVSTVRASRAPHEAPVLEPCSELAVRLEDQVIV